VYAHHGGRTWQETEVVLLDGTSVEGWIDNTWGKYIYFPYRHKGKECWYKIIHWVFDNIWSADLRTLSQEEQC